ncbi:alginate export family protein [Bacteroidales bacterium OttesenSCG-928-I14]|nr:alginate export family protein [Bacteroidales bacterium OttesenSCG-928-I14]
MKALRNIITIILLVNTFCLFAQDRQDSFSISTQLRSRGEYRNGSLFPREEGEMPATFINDRARLSLNYKRPNLEMRLSGQHVGVWGQDPQIDRNGRFMLNEAWGKISYKDFYVQIGRQAISYDDERILGTLDWNTSGRFHDALKAGYSNKLNSVDLILAFNQNEEKVIGGSFYAPGGQPYKSLQTIHYHYGNNNTPFNISFLAMNTGWQIGDVNNASNKFMQTIGTYMTYKEDYWNLSASGYYQTGKNNQNASVSAYMANISFMLKPNKVWSFALASDYLSGNSQNSSKVNAFNPLYGTHHKFYGTMDYFYASAFINNLNPGLWDNNLSVFMKASKKLDASITYHNFLTAENIYFDNKKYDKYLGSEIDLQLNWTIMPDVKLMAGYSIMFADSTMDILKGGNHKSWQDWGWISINIAPQIFSTAK